ncbi:MAG: glycerophosphodiester phosphodiesterase [Roseinatronobacter sp.]
MTQRAPFLSAPRACAIAHRGGSLEGVENTLPAFDHAVRLGYSHVELDVHLTRDGQVVIHHDPTLARVFGDPRAVADMTWSELRQVRAATGESVPLLSDLLEAHPDLFVTIELKSDTVAPALAEVLKQMDAVGRVCLGSFNPARTLAARQALGVPVLWSPAHAQVARLWLAGFGLPVSLDAFAVVQIPPAWNGIAVVTPRFVHAAHKRGIAVQVWTVNDAPQMQTLLHMGVDGLMTDKPSLLRDIVESLGLWG